MSKIAICALYKFVHLPNYQELSDPIRAHCQDNGVLGTLLLAEEGINGTISGTEEGMAAALEGLRNIPALADLEVKTSFAEEHPFHRMKVKLKTEIVRLGRPEVDPTEMVGTYVEPAEWNALISDPDVLVIDTRNDYEIHVGTFKDAVNPHTRTFTQFPEYVKESLDPSSHKKIAMFCTGGIRCEKATSYLLGQGFDEVYHLKGGILKYLEEVPEEDSLWEGECFVFDNRVTVNHALETGSFGMCYACKHPLSAEEMSSPIYVEGLACPYCEGQLSPEQWASFSERQKQVKLAESRGEKHIGQQLEL